MSNSWAIRLSLQHVQRAGELRSWPGVDAAVDGDTLWLRGDGLDASMQRSLAPTAEGPVFHLSDDGRLTAFGNAVPTERLPDLNWRRLADLLQPVLPAARMTSVELPRVALSLERSSTVRQESLLVTDWDSFSRWAVAAPEIRLHGCRFAVSRTAEVVCQTRIDGWPGLESDSSNPRGFLRSAQSSPGHPVDQCRVDGAEERHSSNSIGSACVVIQGNPLPPLDGERYWLAGRVAVPLGYHWTPAVDVATLEAVIRSLNGENAGTQPLCIWNKNDHSIDVVEGSDLIPLTRTNVRETARQ